MIEKRIKTFHLERNPETGLVRSYYTITYLLFSIPIWKIKVTPPEGNVCYDWY